MKVSVFCFYEVFLECFEKCLELGFLLTILTLAGTCLVGDFDGELEFDKEGFFFIIVGLVLDLTTLNKED